MRKKSLYYLWAVFLSHNTWFSKFIPDDIYLKMIYRGYVGKRLDLKTPKTYNEKLQWLKINDRKPIYTSMVDKYEAKNYIAKKIGEKYVVPTLGLWEHFDEIDFDSLPNKFVLKCTHDSGGVIVCCNRKDLDKRMARRVINKSLRRNFYWRGREWPYKNVVPRILAEEFLEEKSNEEVALTDYKFFCFDGIPRVMYISKDRGETPTTDFFDMEFNHLKIRMKDPNAETIPSRPECFDEMKELAAILSKNHRHLRVDFYYINGKVYVGELTFFHNCGMSKISPQEWADKFSNWIEV